MRQRQRSFLLKARYNIGKCSAGSSMRQPSNVRGRFSSTLPRYARTNTRGYFNLPSVGDLTMFPSSSFKTLFVKASVQTSSRSIQTVRNHAFQKKEGKHGFQNKNHAPKNSERHDFHRTRYAFHRNTSDTHLLHRLPETSYGVARRHRKQIPNSLLLQFLVFALLGTRTSRV